MFELSDLAHLSFDPYERIYYWYFYNTVRLVSFIANYIITTIDFAPFFFVGIIGTLMYFFLEITNFSALFFNNKHSGLFTVKNSLVNTIALVKLYRVVSVRNFFLQNYYKIFL